nr:MAG TPA: hypothetical protein [Caudoviricetes sp.]
MNNLRTKAERISEIVDNLIEDYERTKDTTKSLLNEDKTFLLNSLSKKYVLELLLVSLDENNTLGGL